MAWFLSHIYWQARGTPASRDLPRLLCEHHPALGWTDAEQQLSLFRSIGSDLQRPPCEPHRGWRQACRIAGVARRRALRGSNSSSSRAQAVIYSTHNVSFTQAGAWCAGVARRVWFITRTIQSPSEGCVLAAVRPSVSLRQVGLLTRIAAVARFLSHLYRQARGVGPGGRSPGPACRLKFGHRARPGAGRACDRFWTSQQVMHTWLCVASSSFGRGPCATG